MSAGPDAAAGRILLTVEVEDYFQVGRFGDLIQRDQWYRFETRIERNTRKALDLLDQFGIHATFFVLGWVADNLPDARARHRATRPRGRRHDLRAADHPQGSA